MNEWTMNGWKIKREELEKGLITTGTLQPLSIAVVDHDIGKVGRV